MASGKIKTTSLSVIIVILIVTSISLHKKNVNTVSADTVSSANYGGITNLGPQPGNFRPYANNAPWNLKLPENPQSIDYALTPNIQNYAFNAGGTYWATPAQNYLTGCGGNPCGGLGGFPVWKASTNDPQVTFKCTQIVYGCTKDGSTNTPFTMTGYVPANARPGCTYRDHCGDVNFTVIQPDGREFLVYGCQPQRDFRNGDVLAHPSDSQSTGVCDFVAGMTTGSIVTGDGTNGNVTSGPNYPAEVIRYNEMVVNKYIPHAININVSCTADPYVYPGTSSTGNQCPNTGVPVGTRYFLDLSIGEIDALIAAGTIKAAYRPLYVALHEYGGYIIDSAVDTDRPSFDTGSGGPFLEDARPWVTNGQINPWIAWFQANGGYLSGSQGGNPTWALDINLFNPIATHLKALSPCYAVGTCPDSPAPGFPVVTPGSPQPSPTPSTPPVAGDLNLDHIVNSIDWSVMNKKWFTTDTTADINKDGLVNAIDFSIMNANWFKRW